MSRLFSPIARIWRQGCLGKLAILFIVLLLLTCPCALFTAILPSPTPTPAVLALATATRTTQPTRTVVPAPTETATPAPTRTPLPTPSPTLLPMATPTPSIGMVGQRREAGGIALTVIKVSKLDQIDEFLKPDDGNIYLVLEVIIENLSREITPYNPFYFRIKDVDGFEYDSAFVAPPPELKAGDLQQGDKVRGNVAFEIPVFAQGLTVTYEPLVLFGGYQPVRVDLGM